ncbi:MAG TPA: GspH/FimT family pseudopilin [Oleiagrimonas sp.]|nr:GspH/FimT family pseudopilin [Oleiagrimonas sp.]
MRVRAKRDLTACPNPHPNPSPDGRGAQQAGFTLLEMLAVIILIGIAAAAVAVSVTRGLTAARVRAASSDLAAALRYTRTQAIVHAKPEVLALDVKARSYTAPGKSPHTLPKHMRLSVTSAAEDQRAGHVARIRFFPDGSSTGGHVVLSRGARQWRINVAWLTGAISVQAGKAGSSP